ncbi:hypothetical protein TSO5_05600 [Azospirillum sp. TSO5]|nr:hypothetical protein TSO5_05600 [Azospirillum sp. TSO5]
MAIARLKSAPFTNPAPPATEPEPQAATPAEPDRRKWTELPFSQRAAMLCQDKLFIDFLRERFPAYVSPTFDAAPADLADSALKALCRIGSKRELNTDHDAAERFDRLSRAYWAWKQEPVSPAA